MSFNKAYQFELRILDFRFRIHIRTLDLKTVVTYFFFSSPFKLNSVLQYGEIRDAETAEIAVRAAQTGHLVFSTLHTNDSVSAVTRLVDMKIEPFLVASSLVCSVAQRLVRRVCRHCTGPDTDIPEPVRAEMAEALKIDPSEVRASRGRGCIECSQKGSRGGVAIYEFFLVNDEIADLIGPGVKTGELRQAARRHGWRSLREQAWGKVQAGLVPVSEDSLSGGPIASSAG